MIHKEQEDKHDVLTCNTIPLIQCSLTHLQGFETFV